MTRQNAANYSNPGYAYATADGDAFDRLDVAGQGQAMDNHDHSSGNGLAVARLAAGAIADGSITSAMIADGTIDTVDLKDGSVTSAKILDGTIATGDLANAAITNAKLATDTARLNLLTNGGFEIWQRGNGPFTGQSVYSADRWISNIAGSDTLSISKDTTNVDTVSGSLAAAACTFTLSGGAGATQIYQFLPRSSDNHQLANRTVTFSVRVRTSTANAVRPSIYNGASQVYGSYHTGDGTWQTLSITTTMSSTLWQTNIFFAASCTAYIDNAMLVVGSVPADYAPLHPADDLARCLRYYEAMTIPVSNFVYAVAQANTTTSVYANLPFKARKAVVPTLTFSGTYQAAQANGTLIAAVMSTTNAALDSAQISGGGLSGMVAGNASMLTATAGAIVGIEANP